MSADRWAICPNCKRMAEKKRENAKAKLDVSYGKVSAEKYLELVALANEEIELDTNLREDYEQGTDEDGEYYVSYSCQCNECDFSWQYKHKETIIGLGE